VEIIGRRFPLRPDDLGVMMCAIEGGLIGYVLGSFPTGYLIGRLCGVDVRKVGSGNIGATNLTRVLGKQFGYSVFLIDFLKGLVAVLLAQSIADRCGLDAIGRDFSAALGGISSVIGHSYPVWLGFKGGKGVATSLGVTCALSWLAVLIMGVVWIVFFKATRYVSVASIAATIALPIVMVVLFFLHALRSPVPIYFSLFLAAIVIVRHRTNVARLASGTEPRFNRK
jgi:glycerol-3-phosphate acyltransferase PlsY